jgi:hypothetical protein
MKIDEEKSRDMCGSCTETAGCDFCFDDEIEPMAHLM